MGEYTTSDKDVLILNLLVASKSEGFDPESVMPRPRDSTSSMVMWSIVLTSPFKVSDRFSNLIP